MAQGKPLQLCEQVLFNNYYFFEKNMIITEDYKGQEVKEKQILVLHLVCIGIYCIYAIYMSMIMMVQHCMEDGTFDDQPRSCAETLQAL